MSKIIIHVGIVGPRRLDYCIHDRQRFGAINRVAKQEILSANSHSADMAFAGSVVNWDIFDVSQHVINNAAGVIAGSTNVTPGMMDTPGRS